jgi:uncharacterized SAM-binding protein YcdF (DUF218 family)
MYIYFHKIIPNIFLPIAFTLIILLIGLFLNRRIIIIFAIILLWLSSTPIISSFAIRTAEAWEERINVIDAEKADAIVVLSSGRIVAPGSAAISEWSDADRFFGGVELFQAGKAPILIFTGGWLPWEPNTQPEGDILIKYAMALGVPRGNMLSTSAVVNTAEEARAVAELLTIQKNFFTGTGGNAKILLVTSAFHMPRARSLFELNGLQVIPFPVDFRLSDAEELSILDFLPRAGALSMTELALREFYGRVFYWLIG